MGMSEPPEGNGDRRSQSNWSAVGIDVPLM
jgi:hypothetical protein